MTKDYKNMRKWTQDDEESLDVLMAKIAVVAAFLIAVVTTAMAFSFSPASATEAVKNGQESVYSHVISPEMSSYIRDSRIGRKQFVREWDVE